MAASHWQRPTWGHAADQDHWDQFYENQPAGSDRPPKRAKQEETEPREWSDPPWRVDKDENPLITKNKKIDEVSVYQLTQLSDEFTRDWYFRKHKSSLRRFRKGVAST